ncbi:hypothetical protein CesoFtcFv8_022648 [Champsocephalus esox]|uniref:Uncharacterized protein n=1 Tax=Champsocephalus esox TaxID=159716 RepID=A0AAN8GHJ1_9TELE|nr:hypothetical protein CesoFtcFv8_022648 [Champsocephalus esox]
MELKRDKVHLSGGCVGPGHRGDGRWLRVQGDSSPRSAAECWPPTPQRMHLSLQGALGHIVHRARHQTRTTFPS